MQPTWTSTTKVVDALVNLKGKWVRLSAVIAVEPSDFHRAKSVVHLASGTALTVELTVDEVMDLLDIATRQTTNK